MPFIRRRSSIQHSADRFMKEFVSRCFGTEQAGKIMKEVYSECPSFDEIVQQSYSRDVNGWQFSIKFQSTQETICVCTGGQDHEEGLQRVPLL